MSPAPIDRSRSNRLGFHGAAPMKPGEHLGAGDVKRDRNNSKSRREGKTFTESISVYPKDRELLLAIMDYYGCGKAEAFRTVLRAHAAMIGVK